jgi:hypothetical protein
MVRNRINWNFIDAVTARLAGAERKLLIDIGLPAGRCRQETGAAVLRASRLAVDRYR